MTHIGIMIEGQEDLTWERFFRLAQAVEDLGFESLFRSDHLTALGHFPTRRTLELWSSLTALALRTQRIRFGPLVCSLTFCHPSLLAKKAASIDVLSGGRFELGIGAGWYRGEHEMFGLAFPRIRPGWRCSTRGARYPGVVVGPTGDVRGQALSPRGRRDAPLSRTESAAADHGWEE